MADHKKVQLGFRVQANPSIAILKSLLVAGEHLEWADIGTPSEKNQKPPRRVLHNISGGPRHSQQLRCRIFDVFIVSIRSDHDMHDGHMQDGISAEGHMHDGPMAYSHNHTSKSGLRLSRNLGMGIAQFCPVLPSFAQYCPVLPRFLGNSNGCCLALSETEQADFEVWPAHPTRRSYAYKLVYNSRSGKYTFFCTILRSAKLYIFVQKNVELLRRNKWIRSRSKKNF